MLKTIPSSSLTPVLVLIAHTKKCASSGESSVDLEEANHNQINNDSDNTRRLENHRPSHLRPLLNSYDIPWAVSYY